MKPFSTLLFLALAPSLICSCSLVTVPVKTAGKIVTTTVSTAGSVAEAPFKAVAGRREHSAPEQAPAQANQ